MGVHWYLYYVHVHVSIHGIIYLYYIGRCIIENDTEIIQRATGGLVNQRSLPSSLLDKFQI